VGAFASAEHPLVLLLDDCQWADTASTRFLQCFDVERPKHVLLVCTFRTRASSGSSQSAGSAHGSEPLQHPAGAKDSKSSDKDAKSSSSQDGGIHVSDHPLRASDFRPHEAAPAELPAIIEQLGHSDAVQILSVRRSEFELIAYTVYQLGPLSVPAVVSLLVDTLRLHFADCVKFHLFVR